jgi:8-oxo-dGTP pyrophosphatase MutT (NUDIX family)
MTERKKSRDDNLPIEVLNRHLACENEKFFVYFDHVVDKEGSEVLEYLVVAPKNAGKNLVSGVAILPVIEGQVGLIRIYRPALREYSWEIPHGFVDVGEDGETSALRELLEETGLVGDPRSFSSLGFITPDSGVLAARVHLYVVEAKGQTSQREHELGLREFRFFDFQEVENMIERSVVQDTFTLAAWCKYRLSQNFRRLVKTI